MCSYTYAYPDHYVEVARFVLRPLYFGRNSPYFVFGKWLGEPCGRVDLLEKEKNLFLS
jgi:hypothetical protein